MDATIDMMRTLRAEAPKLHFTLGCSTFVPKVSRPRALFCWNAPVPLCTFRTPQAPASVCCCPLLDWQVLVYSPGEAWYRLWYRRGMPPKRLRV